MGASARTSNRASIMHGRHGSKHVDFGSGLLFSRCARCTSFGLATAPMSKRARRHTAAQAAAGPGPSGFAEIRGSCGAGDGERRKYTARYPKMLPVSLLKTVWQQWLINCGCNKTSMSQAPRYPTSPRPRRAPTAAATASAMPGQRAAAVSPRGPVRIHPKLFEA